MSECTERERATLDYFKECDVVFALKDEDMTSFSFLRHCIGKPPATFSVDYDTLDGERVVRRLKLTLGMTAKQFAASVERGRDKATS